MSQLVLVEAEGVKFFVEVREVQGASTAGGEDAFDFSAVSGTICALGKQLHRAWVAVLPDEATVEFGLDVAARPGKLTALLVDGEAKATLNVKMVWKKTEVVSATTA